MQEDPFWPSNPSGFVFLARAVDEIGRATWRDAWCGSEVAWGGRTISTFGAADMLRSMRDLPEGHPQSTFAKKWLRGGGDDFSRLWKLAAEELRNDPQGGHAANAASRLFSIHRMMTALFEGGALTSFGRPLIGGALQPLSRDLWRSELLANRWSSFQIDLWHPFGSSSGPYDLHWIFVERAAFEGVLAEVLGATDEKPDFALEPKRSARGLSRIASDFRRAEQELASRSRLRNGVA